MYKYNKKIKKLKSDIKKTKRKVWPGLSLNYSYSFNDVFDKGFDNSEHKLELSLGGSFSLTNYDNIEYGKNYSLKKGDLEEKEDEKEKDEETDNYVSLSLFSFPKYRRSKLGNRKANLKTQIELAKKNRDRAKAHYKQKLKKDIDKINHFRTLYLIEKKREIKFEKENFNSKVEKLKFLIEKLEFQLKLEEYKFNYSYLYSRLKRRNKESKKLLKILKNNI